MRIAILCNGRTLCEWQNRAIAQIAAQHELYLLAGDEPAPPRQLVRHGLYYLLNLASIRNRLTKSAAFPGPGDTIADRIDFVPDVDGAWASLPDAVIGWVSARRIDVIVKFGLGLLRVPAKEKMPVPILSYHHGDPRSFRGRPAGFYELLAGEKYVGQVVQILGDRLDGGEVLAFAQSRVSRHSYKASLIDAFALSPWLLPKALRNLASGERVQLVPEGRNFRLPSNVTVLRFVARLAAHRLRRLAYGAFIEKRWRVSSVASKPGQSPDAAILAAEQANSRWRTLEVRPPHRFHADPFFIDEEANRLVVEAMSGRTGKGELMLVEGNRQHVLGGMTGHASYPFPIEEGGRTYIVPEISIWDRPAIFAIEKDGLRRIANLDIDETQLLDPTLVRHDGRVYLFANRDSEGPAVLRLWSADGLFGRFEPHPESPVRISIRGARMAGEVRRWGGDLMRLGQDFQTGYGDGVMAFRIEALTPRHYREVEAGSASFRGVKGPHTVNERGGRLLFDWYVEHMSLLAGVRRLMNRI